MVVLYTRLVVPRTFADVQSETSALTARPSVLARLQLLMKEIKARGALYQAKASSSPLVAAGRKNPASCGSR